MAELALATPLILASTSATRRALCAAAGLRVECHAPQVDETALKNQRPDLSPAALASHLAEAKALEVSCRFPKAVVIGGDQICALGTRMFGKAGTAELALESLLALQDQTHAQHSGWAMAQDGALLASGTETAHLTMRAWPRDALIAYIAKEQPLASAGSYHFEEMGRLLFSQVEGTQDVILGLALQPVLDALFARGLIAF